MRNILISSMIGSILMATPAFAAQKHIVMEYEAPSQKQQQVIENVVSSLPEQCSFSPSAALDLRQNKQTIAFKFSKSLIGDGVTAWIDNAFSHYLPDRDAAVSATQVTIVPKLHRLYAYPESMNILGVTALELDFVVDDQVSLTRHYRGFYAKTNLAGGDGEYVTALNYALNDSMPKITKDLADVCASIVAQHRSAAI